MDIFGVLALLGGLAIFLYGMDLLGEGLTGASGGKLENILEKLTSNPIKAVLLGAGVTAVIQSSSATTVMVVGFVNSGIIMPIACLNFIIPELTKPTTITVVADDDCITAVTAIPSNTAIILLEVSFSSICSNLPPDSFAKESPMTFIPYKNKASPPAIVSTPKIFILHKLLFERLFHTSCVF